MGVSPVVISGEIELPAAPERLRAVLADPALLARLLGASPLTAIAPGRWRGSVALGTPPLTKRHPILVQVRAALGGGGGLELDVVEEGTSSGFSLTAHCALAAMPPDRTRLRYDVDARLGGLARWIGGSAARRFVDDFFAALVAYLSE